MINFKQTSICTLFILTVSAGCLDKSNSSANINKSETPIVSVEGKVLYTSDLDQAIPDGLSAADSATAADNYIKRWISEVLLYKKAKSNVSNQVQINKLVEDYRQSLTVYTYQEQLLDQVLAKKNDEKDLKQFYEKNTDQFKLDSYLIKGLFLKIPSTSTELPNLRKWYQSNNVQAKESIEKASIQHAVMYNYFYDTWLNLEEITSNIPSTISSPEQFLRSNKNYETSDSTYVYLLHIEDYKLPGSTAPYEYAKTFIKDYLINQERNSFINKLETDLYNDALDNGEIKFYNK